MTPDGNHTMTPADSSSTLNAAHPTRSRRRASRVAIAATAALLGTPLVLAATGWMAPLLYPNTNPDSNRTKLENAWSFAAGHPDWFVLRTQNGKAPTDTTPYRFGHALHVGDANASEKFAGLQTAKAQIFTDLDRFEALAARVAAINAKSESAKPLSDAEAAEWAALAPRGEHLRERARHLSRSRVDGKDLIAMSCTYCHVTDSRGMYMEPIRFDQHCVDCHTGQLKTINFDQREGADKKVPEIPVPHKTSDEIAAAALARAGLTAATLAGPLADATDLDSFPPKFKEPGDNAAWVGKQVADLLFSLQDARNACGYCHEAIKEGPTDRFDKSPAVAAMFSEAEKRQEYAKLHFIVDSRKIPEVWLPKSVFSHASHNMVSCVQCHAGATVRNETSDIMLPGIDSCRECHAPAGTPVSSESRARINADNTALHKTLTTLWEKSGKKGPAPAAHADAPATFAGGAPDSCVTCHTFHVRTRPGAEPSHRGLTIPQVRAGVFGIESAATPSKPASAALPTATPTAPAAPVGGPTKADSKSTSK